jgi:hypothetical protein
MTINISEGKPSDLTSQFIELVLESGGYDVQFIYRILWCSQDDTMDVVLEKLLGFDVLYAL